MSECAHSLLINHPDRLDKLYLDNYIVYWVDKDGLRMLFDQSPIVRYNGLASRLALHVFLTARIFNGLIG